MGDFLNRVLSDVPKCTPVIAARSAALMFSHNLSSLMDVIRWVGGLTMGD